MTHSFIYVRDNTHVVEVVDLQDHLGVVQTDAVVQLTSLVDARTGVAVTGVALPLTLLHIADGLYRETLPHNLVGLVAGRSYVATVKAVGSQGFRGEWDETVIAKVRVA